MPTKKEGYFMTKQARHRFKVWLLNNDLSMSKFAERCGVSRQYISAVITSKVKITDSVIATFKKGGYDLI